MTDFLGDDGQQVQDAEELRAAAFELNKRIAEMLGYRVDGDILYNPDGTIRANVDWDDPWWCVPDYSCNAYNAVQLLCILLKDDEDDEDDESHYDKAARLAQVALEILEEDKA